MKRIAAAGLAVVMVAGCSAGAGETTASRPRTPPPATAAPSSTSPAPSAAPSTAPPAASPPPRAASCTVAAAGDIAGADDYRSGAAKTAALISAAAPDKVLALGDLAYSHGTVTEFRKYYRPTWGRFRAQTEAVPGNHDVGSGDAGIRSELGPSAVENRGVDVCGWRVVLVNPYEGMARAAQFITADAEAHPSPPKIVLWHAPRYSSGSEHGNDESVQPLWAAAVRAGARIVLNGHDHDYERFAPMDETGATSARGTRQFVSGLGGHHVRGLGATVANSERRFTGQPAVLFLTLRADGGYSWSLRSIDGIERDAGSG